MTKAPKSLKLNELDQAQRFQLLINAVSVEEGTYGLPLLKIPYSVDGLLSNLRQALRTT